ncbi:MAG TPA: nucleoside 2-deoxyribosyltransferase [Chryseosolibacter sp.]
MNKILDRQAYISVSYRLRKSLEEELNVITQTLARDSYQSFVFVDRHQFLPSQEKEMMQQAMADIDRSVILLAEASDKGSGIGIEVGYAKAKRKPVIYLRKMTAEHSTTVSGISDFQIIYEDVDDLREQLSRVLQAIQRLLTFPEQISSY